MGKLLVRMFPAGARVPKVSMSEDQHFYRQYKHLLKTKHQSDGAWYVLPANLFFFQHTYYHIDTAYLEKKKP